MSTLIGEMRIVMAKAERPITLKEVRNRLAERGISAPSEELEGAFVALLGLGIVKEAGRKGFFVLDKERDNADR